MTKRVVIIGLSFLFLALVAAFLVAPPLKVEITQSEIEDRLEDKLPYAVTKWGAEVTVTQATIRLRDENKLVIKAQFYAAGATLEGVGTAAINSAVRFDNGRFYLSDLRHENIKFEFSENSRDTIADVRSTLKGIFQRESQEAEGSEDANRIDRVARAKAYYETKLRTDAIEALDTFLSSFPVYDLGHSKGTLRAAALALDDIKITSEKILVTLSLQTLIFRLASSAGFLLVIAAFLMSPLLSFLGKLR